MQESVQQFLREFNRVKKDYRFIDLNIVAVRWTTYWLNICTRVTLLTDSTQRRRINVPKDLPDNLKIVSSVLPIDDLEKILNIFESGFYNFNGEIIGYYRLDPSSKPTIPVYPYFSINKRDSSKQILELDQYTLSLTNQECILQNTIQQEGINKIESNLACLQKPFSDIGDFIMEFTGHRSRSAGNKSYCYIEIIVPIQIRLSSKCKLTAKEVSISAFMQKGHDLKKVKIGIIMREGNTVIKRDQKSVKVVGRINGITELGVKGPVDKGVDNVELLLTYEGIYLESYTLFTNRSFNRNPKMGIFSAIDSELTDYHQGIAGRKRKTGGGFEQAMIALLTFLGFSCIHTGDGSENPDILAWGSDPSIVYVFECTIAEPDLRGKSTKFATRIRHIEYQNPQSTVIGILATILHREMINPVDIDRLRSDGIILLSHDEIEKINELAIGGASVDDLANLINDLSWQ